jgi:hypothetical protein
VYSRAWCGLEGGHGLGHRGVLLADGHVDALHALPGLVDDGVDGDRGLAGLAVADDQLALAAADGRHGVDGLDAGLHGLAHRLAAHDARRLDLHAAGLGAVDRALAVDRLTQGVDHPAQEGVAHRHGLDPAGGLDRLLLFEVVDLAQDDGADGVLVEVEGQAQRPVLELEQLVHRRAGQARHAGDAVADLDDPADLLGPDRRGVLLHVALQRRGDLTGVDRQFCHQPAPSVCVVVPLGRTAPVWNPLSSQPPGMRCSRKASIRPRAVASTWRSPIWMTAPLSSASSMTTCSSTGAPARLASESESVVRCASSMGAAARTRAMRQPRALAVCSTSQSSVPTMSRARPPATT